MTPAGGCNPARVHQSVLEVMNNTLAIDDGHPLALELQSLRETIAKYQVFVVRSHLDRFPHTLTPLFRSTRQHLCP